MYGSRSSSEIAEDLRFCWASITPNSLNTCTRYSSFLGTYRVYRGADTNSSGVSATTMPRPLFARVSVRHRTACFNPGYLGFLRSHSSAIFLYIVQSGIGTFTDSRPEKVHVLLLANPI